MNYFIAFAVFLVSIGGTALFLKKKVALVLSEVEERRDFGVKEMVKPFWEQTKQSHVFQRHAPEKILHKTLSKARIFALKMESKTAFWLEKLRVRAQKKNGTIHAEEKKKLPRDYWEQLKK